eukprot:jgi/Mesen1/2794/ME000170S01903
MEHTSSSAKEAALLLCDFLEVACHLILYVRGVYPPELFERRRHYEIPVQWARHPDLREYIHSATHRLQDWIQQGAVNKVAIVILDDKHCPVERFVFTIQTDQSASALRLPVKEIEYVLRAFLLKITVCDSALTPIPPDCTWEIVAYTKQLPSTGSANSHFWLPADASEMPQPSGITPIKSLDTSPLKLQLHVEQPFNPGQ